MYCSSGVPPIIYTSPNLIPELSPASTVISPKNIGPPTDGADGAPGPAMLEAARHAAAAPGTELRILSDANTHFIASAPTMILS